MTENELALLLDLHLPQARQGPGGVAETERMIELAGLEPNTPLKIADIGCGTGASTLTLASRLNAEIRAVDFLQGFLDELETRAKQQQLDSGITSLCASMDDLPFEDESFDVIWSEGAIYNMGFSKGVVDWKRFLKPEGLLVVSEITWLTEQRPTELERYWQAAYPEIDTASAKLKALEQNGYSPVGYFPLPESCWLENYYQPLVDSFEAFLTRNGHSEQAQAIVDAEHQEIALYKKHKAYYSYGVYIARKQT